MNNHFRLGKGAFAQANSSESKSSTDTNAASTSTTTSSGIENQSTNNKNVVISARLRQTDKRLRKIHSLNGTNGLEGDKSKRALTEKWKAIIFYFVVENTIEVAKASTLVKQPTTVNRNKNGQFTSSTNEIKSNKKKIVIYHIFICY